MNKVYLLLGSNLSDPGRQLKLALQKLSSGIGRIEKRSSLYQTAAWGDSDQPDFLNQVIIIRTDILPEVLLDKILEIEKKMGRIRTVKNSPRLIDIDILFFNNEIIHKDHLTIPHPAIPHRRFVLVPMQELSPDFIHPVLKKTITVLLSECDDKLDVKKF